MSLEAINPSHLDRLGVIALGTGSVNAAGEKIKTYVSQYAGVRAKRLNPLKGGGGESLEARQDVGTEEASWLIRKEDRVISSKDTVFITDGKTFNITQIRPYKGSRNWLVLDTVWKDNVNVTI